MRFNIFDFINWNTYSSIQKLPEQDRPLVLAHEILRVLRNELFREGKLEESTFLHEAMIHVRCRFSRQAFLDWCF